MIPRGVEVYVALDPINMAASFDRLAGYVEQRMGRSVRDAAIFLFFNRRRTALKAVFADATGLCIFYKRADRGVFVLPEARENEEVVELSERELDDILDGIELRKAKRGPRARQRPKVVH